MPRLVTNKIIQTHYRCVCGWNVVDSVTFPIRWKDFNKSGIVRRKDKTTGKAFLLMRIELTKCNCNED